jgi:hypothetical protein
VAGVKVKSLIFPLGLIVLLGSIFTYGALTTAHYRRPKIFFDSSLETNTDVTIDGKTVITVKGRSRENPGVVGFDRKAQLVALEPGLHRISYATDTGRPREDTVNVGEKSDDGDAWRAIYCVGPCPSYLIVTLGLGATKEEELHGPGPLLKYPASANDFEFEMIDQPELPKSAKASSLRVGIRRICHVVPGTPVGCR